MEQEDQAFECIAQRRIGAGEVNADLVAVDLRISAQAQRQRIAQVEVEFDGDRTRRRNFVTLPQHGFGG
ncbi:MAG TPA: hypothetical protein PLP53_08535, partial [Plasticicumulans sp.]|nr:hypothetical protein [Plasticicumulans sp.]